MNTQTTKFVAVLAVMAMAFAGFAAVVAVEDFDATATRDKNLGTFETEYGAITIKGENTLSGNTDGSITSIAGTATNDLAGTAYSAARYSGYGAIGLHFPDNLEGKTGVYVSIVQETILAKNGVLVKAGHQDLDKTKGTLTSKFDLTALDNEVYNLLIPQDSNNMKVKITINFYSNASRTDDKLISSTSHTLDFSDTYTNITLGSGVTGDSYTTAKWAFSESTLTLTDFTGNVSFKYGGDLTIKLNGDNKLTAYTQQVSSSSYDGVITANPGTLTIQTADSAKKASLTTEQLNENCYNIACYKSSSAKMTIGVAAEAENTVLTTTGGVMGIFADGGDIDIKNATVSAQGSEKAIRTGSSGTLDIDASHVTATLIDPEEKNNGLGTNDRFGVKAGSIDVDATSVLTTDGLRQTNASGTFKHNGIIYVLGDYVQAEYNETYGIAGLFVAKSGISVDKRSSASGGSAGTIYVVGDARAYGVTVNGGQAVAVAEVSITTGSPTMADVVTAVKAKAAGKTDLIINVSGTTATTIGAISLDALLADADISALKEITIFNNSDVCKITSVTSTKAIDISSRTIAISGLPVTATFKNGTDSVQLSGVTAATEGGMEISKGSVKIDGSIVSGTIYIDGDAEYGGTVTGTLNFSAVEGKTANLEFLDTFALGASGKVNLQSLTATFDGPVKADDTTGYLVFSTGAVLGSDLTMTNGHLQFASAIAKNLNLKNVTVDGDLTTSGNIVANGVTFSGKLTSTGKLTTTGDKVTFNGVATLSGDVIFGSDVDVKDDMTVSGTVTVAEGKTVTIDAAKKITNSGTMTVNGTVTNGSKGIVNNGVLVVKGTVQKVDNEKTLRLYGTIGAEGQSYVINNGTIVVLSVEADILGTVTGTGTIDTSAVTSVIKIGGQAISQITTYNWLQTVIIIDDTTFLDGAYFTFQGKVIVETGVTVVIQPGAQFQVDGVYSKLENNGTITVQSNGKGNAGLYLSGAQAVNDGTISLGYSSTGTGATAMEIAGHTNFVNNGEFTIEEKNVLTNTDSIFTNNGKLIVYGKVVGTIKNAKEVVINSEMNFAVADSFTIDNSAVGATVQVTEMIGKLTVMDTLMASDKVNAGTNVIVVNATDNYTVGGFIITEGTFKASALATKTTPMMYVSGAITVDTSLTAGQAAQEFSMTGVIEVKETLAVSEWVNLKLTSTADVATTLTVSGIMTVDKNVTASQEGAKAKKAIVTGLITSYSQLDGGWTNVYGASFVIPKSTDVEKTYVYSNVNGAIGAAILADVKTVKINGDTESSKLVQFSDNITIPVGMTIDITGGYVLVAEDKEVIFAADEAEKKYATLDLGTNYLDVDGKLVLMNKAKTLRGTEENIDAEVVVKSGESATYTTLTWAMADVGTEEATITLGGPTVIKKNTVIPENITIDTNGNNFTVQNAELTIDGELYLNGGAYTVTGTNGKVIVNGCISKDSKMTFNDKEYPAGLYLSINDSAEYLIAGIAHAEEAAAVADGTITYSGDLKVNSIDFDAEGILVFEGKVEAKTMEIGSKAKVTFNKDVSIDLVTVGVAAITFKDDARIDGTFVSPVGTIGFEDTYALEDSKITVAVKDTVTTMTLEGSIGNYLALDKYQVTTLGDVIIKANLVELAVGLGEVTIGNKVTVGILEVYGDLVVDNEYKLTAVTAYVYGSLTANAATDTKAKATAEIGLLYAGVEFEDSLAAAAVIAGEVNATTAIVAADATVSDSISEMSYSTDVYAEGVKCLTVYASNSSTLLFTLIAAVDFDISDPNADGPHWYDEDDVPVSLLTTAVGDYDAVYGVWDYNVYSVTIVTDAGVKSVAINGIELVNIGGNVFVLGTDDDPLTPLKAGTYKVTYTLKTGYSGTAVLSTETGTILKDNSFVISPGSETDLSFQLAGTEPTPEPEPTPTPEEKSEWTITTILLCVLVVLIAIMAVIVALRLNRN